MFFAVKQKSAAAFILPAAGLILLLLCWETAIHIFQIDTYLLPAPSLVILAIPDIWPLLWFHAQRTIAEAAIGLLLATSIAILLAVIMDLSRSVRQALLPLLIVSQTIPVIAIAPLLMIWFGFEWTPKILIVTLVCFFPIVVNLSDGFQSVNKQQVRLLRAMGANLWQVFRMMKIPSAMPNFFSGMRIAATYSIMGAVIAEWLGGTRGLGIYLIRSTQSFQIERTFVIILAISILSLAVYIIIEIFARWLMPWHHRKREGSS